MLQSKFHNQTEFPTKKKRVIEHCRLLDAKVFAVAECGRQRFK